MKKYLLGIFLLLPVLLCFSGCAATDTKTASLSYIYAAAAILSLFLLIGCCLEVRKKKIWFVLLFSSVLVVNIGYTFLSISTHLEMALWANCLSYLGSVFLPLSMLMIILDVTNTKYPKWLHGALVALSVLIFLIAASPGILPIYYKEVSFAVINGVSTLVKVYGPLHPLYLLYLLGYFSAMITVIIRASIQKTIANTSHAVILAIAVFVNIGVWFIEQISQIDFEFLSISYIISELFLIGVHLIMNENQRLRELVKQKDAALQASSTANADVSPDAKECFIQGLKKLTATEQAVYTAYLAGKTTKEVMAQLCITENTLKFHNKNIYSKLCVSSRKQLLQIHKAIEADQITNRAVSK